MLPDLEIITPKRGYPRLGAADERRLKMLRERAAVLLDDVIAQGFGRVRYSELRKMTDNPTINEMFKVDAEIFAIYAEFERRTGVKAAYALG